MVLFFYVGYCYNIEVRIETKIGIFRSELNMNRALPDPDSEDTTGNSGNKQPGVYGTLSDSEVKLSRQ